MVEEFGKSIAIPLKNSPFCVLLVEAVVRLGSRPLPSKREHSLGFPRHGDRHLAHHHIHHREVLQVVVSLEQGVSGEEFDQDTADREHVAGEAPTETCDSITRVISDRKE